MKSELFLRPEERDLFPLQSLLRYEAPLLLFCPLNGLLASSPARGTLGSSRRPARLLTSLRVEAQDSKEEAAGVNQVQAQNEHPSAPPLTFPRLLPPLPLLLSWAAQLPPGFRAEPGGSDGPSAAPTRVSPRLIPPSTPGLICTAERRTRQASG